MVLKPGVIGAIPFRQPSDVGIPYFIELLKEFARRKGLRKLRIRRIAQTKQGRDMLERAGFQPVPGRTDANGIGYWEKIIDVD